MKIDNIQHRSSQDTLYSATVEKVEAMKRKGEEESTLEGLQKEALQGEDGIGAISQCQKILR